MSAQSKRGFFTRAVHAGAPRDRAGSGWPSVPPIHPATTYSYDHSDDLDAIFNAGREGFVYSRYGSPTVDALERAVSELEGGVGAVAFASGMAAIHAGLLAAGLVEPSGGDVAGAQPVRVAVATEAYGSTRALGLDVLGRLGAEVRLCDVGNLAAVRDALDEGGIRALLCESIANPLLRVADLPALAELAHAAGALLIVDSTFATPYLWRPLELGADLVVHSATKFLGGHGDATLGLCVAGGPAAPALLAQVRKLARLVGGVASPFDAFLVHRGLRTLPLRMARQSATALELGRRLSVHPRVARVVYPGLLTHGDHALARRFAEGRGYGGVLAFELKDGTLARAKAFLDGLELCTSATSLGDVASLVLVPAMTSHREVPALERARLGITDGLIRLSVGLEDVEDLYADLDRALAVAFL